MLNVCLPQSITAPAHFGQFRPIVVVVVRCCCCCCCCWGGVVGVVFVHVVVIKMGTMALHNHLQAYWIIDKNDIQSENLLGRMSTSRTVIVEILAGED